MFTWAPLTTPWDSLGAQGSASAVLPSGRQLVGGQSTGAEAILTSDDGGGTWTPRPSPFDLGAVRGFAHSVTRSITLAVGLSSDGLTSVAKSPDNGNTWVSCGDPFSLDQSFGLATAWCVWRDDGQDLFVIGASNLATVVVTTPDAVTFAPQSTPLDGNAFNNNGYVQALIFSVVAGAWVAVGRDGSFGTVYGMTSADAVTWAAIAAGPFAAGSAPVTALAEDTVAGLLVAGGSDSGTGYVVATSPDAAAWTPRSSPQDGFVVNGVASLGGNTLAVGAGAMESADGGLTWVADPSSMFAPGIAAGAAVCFTADSIHALGVGNDATVTLVAEAGVGTPPPPVPHIGPSLRQARVTQARVIITDLAGVVTTWLERNHLGIAVNANLNQAWQITGAVRAGDPAVNRIYETGGTIPAGDGFPLLAQSNRLVYVLLREAPSGSSAHPWVCEASGIIMSPEDEGDADIGTTHFTAYDPWQYLRGIPCFNDDVGGRIPPLGRLFTAGAFPDGAAQIAAQLLSDSISSLAALGYGPSAGPFIDLPATDVGGGGGPYAGSGFYNGGGVNPTPPLTFTVQQGSMLGDVFDQLVAAGSDASGTSSGCDIVMEPIYDPTHRRGYVSQLAIYPLAGVERPASPMGWARFTRSATTADRQHDGTPGSFVNIALFGAGQGGADGLGSIQANMLSVTAFYSYWAQAFYPGQPIVGAVENLAMQTLNLHKQGKRTYAVDPDPLRAGSPFVDYAPGDRVNVLAPNALRVGNAGYHRVQTIPLQINPDGFVRVAKLLTSPDWRGDDTVAAALAPTFGPPGTAGVTIVCSGFAALTALAVFIGGVAAAVTAGGTTDASGNATLTFTVGASPLGSQTLYVTDGASTATSLANFVVT